MSGTRWIRLGLLALALMLLTGPGPFVDDAPGGHPVLDESVRRAMIARARPGDLVFRRGGSALSEAVRAAGSSRFTHVGVVVPGETDPAVIHAAPIDSVAETGVHRTDLTAFLADRRALRAGLFRVVGLSSDQRARMVSVARTLWRARLPFDRDLRWRSKGPVYCTELVGRALQAAGRSVGVPFDKIIDVLGFERHILTPDGLAASPHLQLVIASSRTRAKIPTLLPSRSIFAGLR